MPCQCQVNVQTEAQQLGAKKAGLKFNAPPSWPWIPGLSHLGPIRVNPGTPVTKEELRKFDSSLRFLRDFAKSLYYEWEPGTFLSLPPEIVPSRSAMQLRYASWSRQSGPPSKLNPGQAILQYTPLLPVFYLG